MVWFQRICVMPRLRTLRNLIRVLPRCTLGWLYTRVLLLHRVEYLTYSWSCVLIVICWLVISPPSYKLVTKDACPPVGYEAVNQHLYIDSGIPESPSTVRPVNCNAIFRGDPEEITYASQYQWCRRPDALYEKDYLLLTRNCDHFRSLHGYMNKTVTHEEERFPIAFSILLHEEPEQAERLLRAIYRPHNIYCIHVDYKSSVMTHYAMKGIANCLGNVEIVEHPVSVHWAEISVVEAEMKCLHLLWEHRVQWKYLINLTGREFPLRTNRELVQILQIYNGANDIDGTAHQLVFMLYILHLSLGATIQSREGGLGFFWK